MINNNNSNHYKVVIIGAGQTGLSVGYQLSRHNIQFIILDANERIGDVWRNRWDSLRLFTPAKFDSLAGMTFPASPNYFPTKDEMADYLESYARKFNLPVWNGMRVNGLFRSDRAYEITANDSHFRAEHVVIAMSDFQIPKTPDFAQHLDPEIRQFHSLEYRNPSQFNKGGVLVVGAGNSGAEIALEAVKNNHKVWLSGRDTGHIPFHIESRAGKLFLIWLVIRFVFHRVLTTSTYFGRKAREKILSMGMALIRIKPGNFKKTGVVRVPKLTEIKEGRPCIPGIDPEEIKNVVWCTGFHPSFSWIDLPVFQNGKPLHERGVVMNEPGLYFIGLRFLYSLSSDMVHAAARDSKYIAEVIRKRINTHQEHSPADQPRRNPGHKEKIYG